MLKKFFCISYCFIVCGLLAPALSEAIESEKLSAEAFGGGIAPFKATASEPFVFIPAKPEESAAATNPQPLMGAAKAYLDSGAPGVPPEDRDEALRNMNNAAEALSPLPSIPIMIINIVMAFLSYMFLPLLIRFVFLRRAVRTRRAAILTLLPIFIVFAVGLNIQRDQAHNAFCREVGPPSNPTSHVFGSPLLYVAMAASYYILRRKEKKFVVPKNKTPTSQAINAVESEKQIKLVASRDLIGSLKQWNILKINKYQAVAIVSGVFIALVSCWPIWAVANYVGWWQIQTLSDIKTVFTFPFIGISIAVIMIFVAFLKE